MLYATGIIFLALIISFFIFFFNYMKLKDIKVYIDTCAVNINEVLIKKLEIVNKLLDKIDNEKIKKEFSYDENATLYEREDSLFNVSFEINKFVKDNKLKNNQPKKGKGRPKKKVDNDTDLSDNLKDLSVLEENLDGLKDFYNANVLNYNEIFYKKVFNKIFILLKFENYKSFKIRKLEEYEIFKN